MQCKIVLSSGRGDSACSELCVKRKYCDTTSHTEMPRLSQGGHKAVTRLSQGGHKVVTRWSRGGHEVVTRWSQGGHKVVALSQGSLVPRPHPLS